MAIESYFDQVCDIYHLEKSTKNLGYGIGADSYSYPQKASIEGVPCHFNIDAMTSMEQTETANEYIYTGKLNLPTGTGVKVNDKIVEKETGLEYYAQIPRNVRGHHVVVIVQRRGKMSAL